jgi:hypothetical protein
VLEVLRTSNPVLMSFALSVLIDARIHAVVFDGNIASLEGTVGAFPRRLMVADTDVARAVAVLADAELD